MKTESILLSDLQDLLQNKSKYFVSQDKGYQGVLDNYGGRSGEYNETFKYYRHPGLPEGVFMRETWQTDSYGSNDSITSVDFVKGRAKQITVYEPI